MERLLSLTNEDQKALQACVEHLRPQLETVIERRIQFLSQAEEIPTAVRRSAELPKIIRRATERFMEALESKKGQQAYLEELKTGAEIQAQVGTELEFRTLFAVIVSNKYSILPLVVSQYADDLAQAIAMLRAVSNFFDVEVERTAKMFIERKEATIATHKQEIIDAQNKAIQELSSPVIQVWEGVLVLPLVGAIDSERARRMTEDLLNGIVARQAEQVIIDITGVPVVDTSVANHLLQTIKAARLLGTRCLLVGIRSEVAQAMVHLGIDLTEVTTRANLQAGIEYVLGQMGLGVAPLTDDGGDKVDSERVEG